MLPGGGADAVSTGDDGLVAGEVQIPVGDFAMPGLPRAGRPARALPVVLVVSEIFGVHEHIADVARRFAQAGYLAVAPELFVRQGDAAGDGDIAKLIARGRRQGARRAGDERPRRRVAWAGANGGDAARLGITGFCWGGRIVWLYAAHNPGVKAGVAWYGRLVGAPTALQPRIRSTSRPSCTGRCSACTAAPTPASRSTR